MYKAKERYNQLSSGRTQFLDMAVECSELTLPYLVTRDDNYKGKRTLQQPWQSVGAKAVVTLAAKLMLATLPPQTSFFKLQVRDDKLGETLDPNMRTELDLSFSKIERLIMDFIAASNDRVVVHQALKHLIVSGNALIFMGKDGLKHYPLQRYVVNRDGNGNVIEIITKELVSRKVLGIAPPPNEKPTGEYGATEDDAEVYTCVKMDESSGNWKWHQEVDDMILEGSQSTAPKKASSILLSIVAAMFAAVAKSAVLPPCTTPTSSGLPCMIAPLPALDKVCGLVVADGDTRKITLLATLAPSTRACCNPLRLRKSPMNSSTLPRP